VHGRREDARNEFAGDRGTPLNSGDDLHCLELFRSAYVGCEADDLSGPPPTDTWDGPCDMPQLQLEQSNHTALLESIQQRALWLSIRQVDYANRERREKGALKVGGHQTSSASVVTIMTTLYFSFLRAGDLVSVKPHASPVFHALQYLLGNLDGAQLKRLRDFHGLQAYPSRTKDPDGVDFSTGSVGLGAAAPNLAALAHTYLKSHGLDSEGKPRRFISVLGDAELDEGSVWEAIAEPAMSGVGDIVWVVDLNRQSLDRVIPGIRVRSWREMFAANGWEVIDAKYGRRLQSAFEEPNGELLRICIDELSNEAYQRFLRLSPADLREWLPRKSQHPQGLQRLLARWDDQELHDLFGNLGGHDIEAMESALAKAASAHGPAIIFAYTLKGWRLPSVGHPQNHSVLLSEEQMRTLREDLGISLDDEWARFAPDTPEGVLCAQVAKRLRLNRSPGRTSPSSNVPVQFTTEYRGARSTQQAFGAILNTLSREYPGVAERVVTMSPDVASSTNLGGWITKHGAWGLGETEELPADATDGILRWALSPRGQHLELGISENNLFMALGQFGLAHELFGETLLPIGTLYDPFVRRGLDAFFYGLYSGSKFIVVGTPSGVTLASEGGAHQSLMTSSIGTELPELDVYEPCFAQELEWIMLEALARLQRRERSTYLRLTTKPVEQQLFRLPASDAEQEQLRQQVLAGAYCLRTGRSENGYQPGTNVVHLFASGAMVPEALAAQERLRQDGLFANVLNITGPGPLYHSFQHAVQRRIEGNPVRGTLLESLVPLAERVAPIVTVVDAHPHSLAWIGSALGARLWALGVDGFGQSGSVPELYREHRIDAASIAAACRAAVQYTAASE
jgi:pyruvate dehydrogenase E1 component